MLDAFTLFLVKRKNSIDTTLFQPDILHILSLIRTKTYK